jgi:glycosyltransferase involved in cell wall biosynthesis
MRVIYNGIDASRFTRQRESLAAKRSLDLPDDAFVIVSLGRLEPAKGYESLIRALPAVIHAIPSAHVCIGGQGFLKEDLLKLAGSLGVKERVHFVGFKADVRDILEVGDIYVQPSLCDAFPYSVLEALACGLPSIVTNVGGMPEMVKSGENGVVIPPQNPAALAQAVTSLANDNCSRLLFGTRGRAWVQKHCSMTAMYGSTFALYRQLARMDLAGTSLKDHTVVPC